RSRSRRGLSALNGCLLPGGSRRALVAEFGGQLVQRGQVDALGDQRQLVDRLAGRLQLRSLAVGQLDEADVLAQLFGQGGGERVRVVKARRAEGGGHGRQVRLRLQLLLAEQRRA